MTGRRGYGCGGLFFQNEVSIPPLIQNDYLLLKNGFMKQTRQDFFTANGEGIKIMTFTEFARHILRMECGESLELYAVVNRQTRECSRPLSVRKEQWNGTPFYLLGGHGQEVRTINFAGRPKEEFETTCHDVLDSYDAVESIGAVVSRLRELSLKNCISGLRKR